MIRHDGFYWVTWPTNPQPQVAEWFGGSEYEKAGWWLVGTEHKIPDSDVRVLSDRLAAPELLAAEGE